MKTNGAFEVRDYKTSDEAISPEQAAFQVRLYALGLRMSGVPVNRVMNVNYYFPWRQL